MSEIKDKNQLVIKNSATIELERRKGFVNILLQGNPNLYRAWVERNNKIVIDISGESTEYNLDTTTPDYIEIVKNQADNKYYINFVGAITGEGSLVSDDITFSQDGDNTRLTIKSSKFVSTSKIKSGTPDYLFVNVDAGGRVNIGINQELTEKLEVVQNLNKYTFNIDVDNNTLEIRDFYSNNVYTVQEFITKYSDSEGEIVANIKDGTHEFSCNCASYEVTSTEISLFFKRDLQSDTGNAYDIYYRTYAIYNIKLSSNTYEIKKYSTTRAPETGLVAAYQEQSNRIAFILYKDEGGGTFSKDNLSDYITKNKGIIQILYGAGMHTCISSSWAITGVDYFSLVFFEVDATTFIIHSLYFNSNDDNVVHNTYDLSNL